MDALEYIANVSNLPCVVTSFPDITESENLAQWGGVDEYKRWFVDTCKQILVRLRPNCAAVFYVTDAQVMSKVKGQTSVCRSYIDKSFLCSTAAAEVGAQMLWHKIALRSEVGRVRLGSPGYTHMVCYMGPQTAVPEYNVAGSYACPDVIDRGEVSWSKASGVQVWAALAPDSSFCMHALLTASRTPSSGVHVREGTLKKRLAGICLLPAPQATYALVRWLKEALGATEICDPFCGEGTALAAANLLGLAAVGVESSPKRCKRARLLVLRWKDKKLTPLKHKHELESAVASECAEPQDAVAWRTNSAESAPPHLIPEATGPEPVLVSAGAEEEIGSEKVLCQPLGH